MTRQSQRFFCPCWQAFEDIKRTFYLRVNYRVELIQVFITCAQWNRWMEYFKKAVKWIISEKFWLKKDKKLWRVKGINEATFI